MIGLWFFVLDFTASCFACPFPHQFYCWHSLFFHLFSFFFFFVFAQPAVRRFIPQRLFTPFEVIVVCCSAFYALPCARGHTFPACCLLSFALSRCLMYQVDLGVRILHCNYARVCFRVRVCIYQTEIWVLGSQYVCKCNVWCSVLRNGVSQAQLRPQRDDFERSVGPRTD